MYGVFVVAISGSQQHERQVIGWHQMPISKGLHHVVGGDGRTYDLVAGDCGSAFQAKTERLRRQPRCERQCHADLILAGRHQAAIHQDSLRVPPEREGDLAVKPVPAQGKNRDGP